MADVARCSCVDGRAGAGSGRGSVGGVGRAGHGVSTLHAPGELSG